MSNFEFDDGGLSLPNPNVKFLDRLEFGGGVRLTKIYNCLFVGKLKLVVILTQEWSLEASKTEIKNDAAYF
jgi:hypothetical protein